jgi:AcrR family transcriptional regulator
MSQRQPTTDRELRSDAHRNRERLAAAAVAALHRDGPAVPMATIAAEAGVGVGTLYRHFPTREDLLEELTHRSFQLMLNRIERAVVGAATATAALRVFLVGVVSDRNDMVLRSTGGPEVQSARTRATQDELHGAIRELIARGAEDGTIKRDIDVWDIAWLGATLAQPGRVGPAWDEICLRILDTYLAGLGVP